MSLANQHELKSEEKPLPALPGPIDVLDLSGDLCDITNHPIDLSGGYCDIYLATSSKYGVRVALKRMRIKGRPDEKEKNIGKAYNVCA